MLKVIFEFLPFLISSLGTFWLIYKNSPITLMQQINSVLLILLLVLFSIMGRIGLYPKLKKLYQFVLATLLSFFGQLLIFATGGFFSPFLIILHLLTIGFSFILNFGSSISFLLLSVALLISSIILNQNSALLFKQDPFSVVLYGISFLVIVPLIQYISKTYQLNEVLYKKMAGYVKISNRRETSMLRGLTDLVIVTNEKLNILSLNEAAASLLSLSESDYLSHPLLEVLKLVDSNKNKIGVEELSIDQILEDKTTRIMDNFFCQIPNQEAPIRIRLQIRPVVDETQKIVQLVFLVSEAPNIDLSKIFLLTEPILKKLNGLYDEAEHLLFQQKPDLVVSKLEIARKINEDILLLQEINIPPGRGTYVDTALVVKKSLEQVRRLANSLQVFSHFSIDSDQEAEMAYENLEQTNPLMTSGMLSPFMMFISDRYLEIMTKKIIELSLFLASSRRSGQIYLSVRTTKLPQKAVVLKVEVDSPILGEEECRNLLVANYPGLYPQTNLYLGSGLEGMIAKLASQQLGTDIVIKYNSFNSRLLIEVSLLEKTRSIGHPLANIPI